MRSKRHRIFQYSVLMTQNWAIGEVREWFNRTVSKTVVPPGTVGSNPTLSVGYEYIVKSSECVNVWFSSLFTLTVSGEVREWFNRHAWKACVYHVDRGFESHPLRKGKFRVMSAEQVINSDLGTGFSGQ